MLVFWKEDSGRRPRLITPENRGDETNYPSLTKFFDDPDVPFGPGGPSELHHQLVIEKEWDLERTHGKGYLCHPSLNFFRFL